VNVSRLEARFLAKFRSHPTLVRTLPVVAMIVAVAVLLLAVPASPQGDDRPPVLSPISAEVNGDPSNTDFPNGHYTTYVARANDPEGRHLTYEWSLAPTANEPGCNTFERAAVSAVWRHGRLECKAADHTHADGRISVVVTDGAWRCTARYSGAASGTGPAPEACVGAYDLLANAADLGNTSVDPDSRHSYNVFRVDVSHAAPTQRASTPATLNIGSDPGLPVTVQLRIDGRLQRGKCATFSSGFECELPAIRPSQDVAAYVFTSARSALTVIGGRFRFSADLECKPAGETDCSNNGGQVTIGFVLAADSGIYKASIDLFRGLIVGNDRPARSDSRPFRAAQAARPPGAAVAPQDRPRRVEVAVLRLGRRQRGFSGSPNPLVRPSTGARRCSWLRDRRSRFRKTAIGARRTCDAPIWLRASMRGRRWSFRLRKRLPPGRYVVYSRAVTRAGAAEQSFTARDRNRRTFAVSR
jgi:hypothetical protein